MRASSEGLQPDGSWIFPREVPEGVSIYKPRGASPGVKWHVAYKAHPSLPRTVERVSTRVKQTYDRAAAISDMIEGAQANPKLARYDAEARKSLATHLEDYRLYLLDEGNTEHHAGQVKMRAGWVLEHAGVTSVTSIPPSSVKKALGELLTRGSGAKGRGRARKRTSNHYLRAVKQFTAWLRWDKRIAEDPLLDLSALNWRDDVGHARQDLGELKAAALIEAARTGPDVLDVAGVDRAWLIETALETGFRGNELGTLTPRRCRITAHEQRGETFHVGELAEHPVLVVVAAYSKHRREDHQPIRREFAQRLTTYLDGKPLDAPIWRVPKEAVDLIKDDLARAEWAEPDPRTRRPVKHKGIAYQDGEGRFADFHALRHTYVCRLVRAGVSPKECQVLARHASITTTMDYYAHLRIHDTSRAVNVLRRLKAPDRQQEFNFQRATGTDGRSPNDETVNPKAQRKAQRRDAGNCPTSVQTVGLQAPEVKMSSDAKRAESPGIGGVFSTQLEGLEPSTFGSVDPPPPPPNQPTLQQVTSSENTKRSAKRSAPSPQRLRAALERLDQLADQGRFQRDHYAGLRLVVDTIDGADEPTTDRDRN